MIRFKLSIFATICVFSERSRWHTLNIVWLLVVTHIQHCLVAGTASPVVTWTKLDGPLPQSAIIGSGILIIPEVRSEDAGTYLCTVTSPTGVIRSQVLLVVQSKSQTKWVTDKVSHRQSESQSESQIEWISDRVNHRVSDRSSPYSCDPTFAVYTCAPLGHFICLF